MNTKSKAKVNPEIQKIMNFYQYGNISFLEAVSAIMNKFEMGMINSEEAENAIRKISRIKLLH